MRINRIILLSIIGLLALPGYAQTTNATVERTIDFTQTVKGIDDEPFNLGVPPGAPAGIIPQVITLQLAVLHGLDNPADPHESWTVSEQRANLEILIRTKKKLIVGSDLTDSDVAFLIKCVQEDIVEGRDMWRPLCKHYIVKMLDPSEK
jgi:hypothetical protein